MESFPLVVLVAPALCALLAGLLFTFAVVTMPGLENLGDRKFIRAFQVMDRVIQNQQPLLVVVWVGSVVALVAAAALYLLAVQLPTGRVHIPLNNEIQSVDVEAIGEAERKQAR